MAPGVYYIDGSSFALGSQANISGTGVTIIFTSTTPTNPNSFPSISMHAGAVINLAAPKSGTYEGVLFYQDRRAPFAQSTINGNSASNIEGGIYFPSQELTFNGNTGMQTRCIQLVAKRLVFTGNSSVVNECPDDGGAESFPTAMVRLVG